MQKSGNQSFGIKKIPIPFSPIIGLKKHIVKEILPARPI
jgi:hypothetical protein